MAGFANQYERKEILGQGGMGVVYRAFDPALRREVAIKTMLDGQDRATLELFRKEIKVLASLNHPNIVDIYETGEIEENGILRPYFVMPLLPGMPLSKLIQSQPQRLTPDRAVDIMAQVCRGLQAAHDSGLIHRDLKPSNIFVLDDDSVKIIDFGVAHMADQHSSIGLKGTLLYMAPEQLDMLPVTPQTDIFSLGVVAFEMLSRRRPYNATTREELAEAIRKQVPPPVAEFNAAVSPALSQVIHAAMAKQPWHRFTSAREFADSLQKALRGQTIDRFDQAKIEPRVKRAQRALEESEYELASEILAELEAEGWQHPNMRTLRQQIDQAVRTSTIRQLLESARRRFREEEYQLALEKVHQVLQIDPTDHDALELRAGIESKRTTQQIDNWLKLAQQHLQNYSFGHAREAVQNVLHTKSNQTEAMALLSEINRKEQEYLSISREKERQYHAAMESWQRGDVTAALSRLEKVVEMDHQAPERGTEPGKYQSLYNEVRSKHDHIKNSYSEAAKALQDGEYARAQEICDRLLEEFPNHSQFQFLRLDIDEKKRQDLSAYVAKIDREVAAEPDLEKRVFLLEQALAKYPGEPHFVQGLNVVSARRDHINSIAAKARNLEDRGEYADALSQWEILRTVYSQFPGLDYEVERIKRRRDQQAKVDRRNRAVQEIELAIRSGAPEDALARLEALRGEFPNEPEFDVLEKQARDAVERSKEAIELSEQGQTLISNGDIDGGIQVLERAQQLQPESTTIRLLLVESLLEQASRRLDQNWVEADQFVRRALELDAANPKARSLKLLIADRKREAAVSEHMTHARQLQSQNENTAALEEIERGLAAYPNDPQLARMRETLRQTREKSHREVERQRDLQRLNQLEREVEAGPDAPRRQQLFEETSILAQKYPQDVAFQSVFQELRNRVAHDPANLSATGAFQGQAAPPVPAEAAGAAADNRVTPPVRPPAQEAAAAIAGVSRTAGPPTAPPPVPEARGSGGASIAPPAVPPAPPGPAVPSSGAGAKGGKGQAPPRIPPAMPPPVPPAMPPPPSGAAPQPGFFDSLKRNPVAAAGVLILVIGIVGVVAWLMNRPRRTPGQGTQNAVVEVRTNPDNVEVSFEGKSMGTTPMALPLPVGLRELQLSRDGYQSQTVKVNVASGMQPVIIDMLPLEPFLRVVLPAGKVTVDGADVPVHDGSAVYVIKPGDHTLDVADSGAGHLTFQFRLQGDELPVVLPGMRMSGLLATVVAAHSNQARVYWPRRAGLVPTALQPVDAANGLVLPNLSPGALDLAVAEGSTVRHVPVEVTSAKTLQVVIADLNAGTVIVTSNPDGAMVMVDGQLSRRPVLNGTWAYDLTPGQHTIRVLKEGYQEEPGQTIEVKRGVPVKLAFTLKPAMKFATLRTTNATEGADVLVDGVKIGTTDSDGQFESTSIEPGKHKVTLSKPNYDTFNQMTDFAERGSVELRVKLEAFGTVEVTRMPETAEVSYTGADGQTHRLTGNSVRLKKGPYTFTASNGKAEAPAQQVNVKPGQTESVMFRIVEKASASSAKEAGDPLQSIAGPREAQGEWTLLRQGGMLNGKVDHVTFTARRRQALLRKKKVSWFVRFTDARNNSFCELDDKELDCQDVTNGQAGTHWTAKHSLGKDDVMTVDITFAADGRVLHKITVQGTSAALNPWRPALPAEAAKFGFRGETLVKGFTAR